MWTVCIILTLISNMHPVIYNLLLFHNFFIGEETVSIALIPS